jgi:hypothetical protein
MFEQLLGSKTRFKLLQLFINHPDEYYFVRQLTRILDTQINSVRRELEHLEKIGLLRSGDRSQEKLKTLDNQNTAIDTFHQGQKKFYHLNPECFLYPELRALFLKEQVMSEKDLIRDLRKIGSMSYLVLTGVFLGIEHEVKTDILIVGSIDSEKLKKVIQDYERTYNKEINYTVMSNKEYQYRMNINDKFLYAISNSKKIVAIDEIAHEDFRKGISMNSDKSVPEFSRV